MTRLRAAFLCALVFGTPTAALAKHPIETGEVIHISAWCGTPKDVKLLFTTFKNTTSSEYVNFIRADDNTCIDVRVFGYSLGKFTVAQVVEVVRIETADGFRSKAIVEVLRGDGKIRYTWHDDGELPI